MFDREKDINSFGTYLATSGAAILLFSEADVRLYHRIYEIILHETFCTKYLL